MEATMTPSMMQSELDSLREYLTPQEAALLDTLLKPRRRKKSNGRARRKRRRVKERVLSFIEFVNKVKPKYQWYEHCKRLADVLERVAKHEITRLMVFMPPRHGKSELVSRLFTAYYLYLHPDRHVGISSYSAGLAYSLSRAMRENYVRGGGEMKPGVKAVKNWQNVQGGEVWACGVGGEATGRGWHLGVIDDPLKNAEQAASETIREKQKEWYASTWYTREQPEGGVLVVVQTRWNEDDLSGWLLAMEAEDEPEKWHVVSYDALREEEPQEFPETCTVEPDWRQPGEALCPERYGVDRLRKICARVGSYVWNALFQQRPRPKEGAFFQKAWLPAIQRTLLPRMKKFIRWWDKAATQGAGDYTVGALLGLGTDERFYVLDIVRGQWNPGNREAEMQKTALRDLSLYGEVQIWMEQEGGSGGKDSARASVRNLAGFPVRYETATGNKQFRAEPFAAVCQAGFVSVLEAVWNQVFWNEMTAFPFGKNDDQVDAACGAFNKVSRPENRVERKSGAASLRYGFA